MKPLSTIHTKNIYNPTFLQPDKNSLFEESENGCLESMLPPSYTNTKLWHPHGNERTNCAHSEKVLCTHSGTLLAVSVESPSRVAAFSSKHKRPTGHGGVR